jgi:hypothetical protein
MDNVAFDVKGVCHLCREWEDRDLQQLERDRAKREEILEQLLRTPRKTGDYDCILSFSGGKDSCYLLYQLVKEYKLKVLAYISDFDIPDNTWDNIHRTLKALNVDHHVEKPSMALYKRFIRYLLQNQNAKGAVHTVCYFWLDIREGDILRMAMDKKISLIITGYSPGQPDPERMLFEMSAKRIAKDWTPHELFDAGLFTEDERSLFWDPAVYGPNAELPRIIAPYHAWEYDQEVVMEKVVELGLVKNKLHANPVLSNFTLNWLFMYSDLQKLGYNPYVPEFSQLVREGKARRGQWRLLFAVMNVMIRRKVFLGRHVNRSLKWLELKADDLVIKSNAVSSSTRV